MGDILEQIPILSGIVKKFPSMDFEGQKLAERLYQLIIILFAVVGFVWGYVCQQFAQTIYILGAGIALSCLLVIPPWPFFRRHPLKWQEVKTSNNANASSGRKKDKQKS